MTLQDVHELIEELKAVDATYYLSGDESPMSDDDYDQAKQSLRDFADSAAASHDAELKLQVLEYLAQVGAPSTRPQVKLPNIDGIDIIMGSLDNVWPETLKPQFLDKNEDDSYIGSMKVDGVSLLVGFEDGKCVSAVTRGNHTHGYDITDKAKVFCKDVSDKRSFFLRGDGVLPGDIYKQYGYKNRRNGAAGILNRKTTEDAHHIRPVFYEVIGIEFDTEEERFRFLDSLGIDVSPWIKLDSKEVESELPAFLLEKAALDYDCDGVVITTNNSERENVKRPKNKRSFKVNLSGEKATINNIQLNVTRNGRIVPVANFDPFELGGVTISNSFLYNLDTVKRLQLGAGAKVRVVRSAEVIPVVVEVLEPAEFTLPETCPSCGGPLEVDSLDMFCKNPVCPAQLLQRMLHYLEVLEVGALGEGTLLKLGVTQLEELYSLTREEMLEKQGVGEKLVTKVLFELEKTKHAEAPTWLAATGIRGCGRGTSQKLLEKFTLEELWTATLDDLKEVPSIGTKTAQSVYRGLQELEPTYRFLQEKGLQLKVAKVFTSAISVTGTLSIPRKQFAAYAEAAGFKLAGLSKKSEFLVIGEKAGSKAAKAEKLGVPVYTEEEFMTKFASSTSADKSI